MELSVTLDGFLLQLTANGRSEHTRLQYRRHVLQFDAWLRAEQRPTELAAITPEVVAAFLAAPRTRTTATGVAKKPGSMNALRGSLKAFFQHLHAAGAIANDPARLVKRALCSPPPPRAMGEQDEQRFLAALADVSGPTALRDQMLFTLMLRTGLRIGSALGLDVEDVDLENGELRVRSAKRAQPATVYLSDELRRRMQDFIGERTSGPLFVGRGNARVGRRHVHRRLVTWTTKAGIARRYSPHALRHRFAMRLYSETHDVLLVKDALLHRSIASTLAYARTSPTRLRAALGVST